MGAQPKLSVESETGESIIGDSMDKKIKQMAINTLRRADRALTVVQLLRLLDPLLKQELLETLKELEREGKAECMEAGAAFWGTPSKMNRGWMPDGTFIPTTKRGQKALEF